MEMRKHVHLLAMIALLAGCDSPPTLLPHSGGSAYEVLVSGEDEDAVKTVADLLRSVPVEGLPQVEAAYQVSTANGRDLTQATRYARCIVRVDVDSLKYGATRIRYEKNVYAEPQLLIYIGAPGKRQLEAAAKAKLGSLAALIDRAEINAEIARLRDHHNQAAEKRVEKLFGCKLWVSEDLAKSKEGKDFLWLSNDAARGMQNICAYRYKATGALTPQEAHGKRDSVMRANIKGETSEMWMTTAKSGLVYSSTVERGDSLLVVKGLWEMRGDAMGGPFVSHSVRKGEWVVTVEAFVYAPEMEKKRLMRRLQAALYTLNTQQ